MRIENGVRDGECLAGWQCTASSIFTVLADKFDQCTRERMKLEIIENIKNPVEHLPCNICSPSSEVAARISRKGPPFFFLT